MIRLFQVFIPTSVLALLFSEVVLLYLCYILAGFATLDTHPVIWLQYEGGLGRISIAVASVVLGLYFNDLYTQLRVRSKLILVQQVCFVVGLAFLVQALLTYADPNLPLPRLLMILGSALTLVTLPLWRILYGGVVLRALNTQRILFLGRSAVVEEIAEALRAQPELGFTVLGCVEDEPGGPPPRHGEALGTLQDLAAIVERTKPDRIVVGMAERRSRLPVYQLLDLRLSGIPIEDVSSIYEAALGRLCTRELRPSQLIFSAQIGPQRHKVALQSLYSWCLALVVAVLTLPLMLLIAALIKLTSKGPVLYRQTRVGLNGRPFVLNKFRSMWLDAEAETGAVWAAEDDPRITPLGRWLRRLRLDELPQLLNVLKGEMSLVGPRPERPEFVRTLSEEIPYYRQRHCVRPGITGWAQINYKYGNTIEDTLRKLEYDLYYIKNLSVSLDFYIIFHTLKIVLLSRGAQ